MCKISIVDADKNECIKILEETIKKRFKKGKTIINKRHDVHILDVDSLLIDFNFLNKKKYVEFKCYAVVYQAINGFELHGLSFMAINKDNGGNNQLNNRVYTIEGNEINNKTSEIILSNIELNLKWMLP